jgi:hypothetical protein
LLSNSGCRGSVDDHPKVLIANKLLGVAMKQTRHKQTICTNQQSEEWAKLIRKLRWIGMDEEAHHLQMAVCSLPPHERCAVLAGPFSTD